MTIANASRTDELATRRCARRAHRSSVTPSTYESAKLVHSALAQALRETGAAEQAHHYEAKAREYGRLAEASNVIPFPRSCER